MVSLGLILKVHKGKFFFFFFAHNIWGGVSYRYSWCGMVKYKKEDLIDSRGQKIPH